MPMRKGRLDRGQLGDRSRTLGAKVSMDERARAEALHPPAPVERPRTREECRGGPRPCPFVGCKHNMYLDINPAGTIKLNFPELEPWEVPEEDSCAIDIAERGPLTLEEVGVKMNFTRERTRQVEVHGLLRLRARSVQQGIGREDTAVAEPASPELAMGHRKPSKGSTSNG